MNPVLIQALSDARRTLEEKGIESARLESELLLAHILGWERHQLYLNKDYVLTPGQIDAYKSLLERRAAGEPLQYITGVRYFMGLPFYVDSRVLIPRWETELLTEYTISRAREKGRVSILDLCTGSGAIAVSLAVNLPDAEITAADIEQGALEVAKKNAEENGVLSRISFYQGDLFASLPPEKFKGYFDIIVSNPPYVPTGEIGRLMTEVRDYEPISALDGGEDGLDFYRRIARDGWRYLKAGGFIALEIGYGQSNKIQDIFLKSGYYHRHECHKDLAGIERFVVFYKKQGE